jgi:hypothetical protein
MSTESSKSKIFDKIKLYVGIAYSQLNDTTFDSILSKSNNPYDFLFDLVKTTIGENGLETLTQVALSTIITQEYLDKLSDKVYDSIGKTIPENLSSNTTTFDLSLKSIDPSNSFKKPEVSQFSAQTNAFFTNIKNNVLKQAGTSKNINVPGTNKNITMKYVEISGTIETTLPSISAHELFEGLKVIVGTIFSANVVINEIINILFHTDFTKEDAQILSIIRSYTRYETKDVFKMDLKKLLDLELDTNVKGYNIDSSCFRENITVTNEQIDAIIAEPTIQNFKAIIPEYVNETSSTNSSNDYCKNIINTIIEAILSIIVKQPVVLFIMSIINKVLDFGADLGSLDIPALFEKFKTLIEEIFDNIYEDIFCVIFNWIKKYLLKLVVLVTIQLLKEQLEKRKDVLASLSGARFVNKAKEFKI